MIATRRFLGKRWPRTEQPTHVHSYQARCCRPPVVLASHDGLTGTPTSAVKPLSLADARGTMSASTPMKKPTLLAVDGGSHNPLSTHLLQMVFEAEVLGLGFPDALERFHQDVAVDEQAKPQHGPHFHSHLPRVARGRRRKKINIQKERPACVHTRARPQGRAF